MLLGTLLHSHFFREPSLIWTSTRHSASRSLPASRRAERRNAGLIHTHVRFWYWPWTHVEWGFGQRRSNCNGAELLTRNDRRVRTIIEGCYPFQNEEGFQNTITIDTFSSSNELRRKGEASKHRFGSLHRDCHETSPKCGYVYQRMVGVDNIPAKSLHVFATVRT